MRSLRIALFTPDLRAAAGGPPRVVLGSAEALVARGHTVTIFTFAHDASEPSGINVCRFARDRPAQLGRSAAMRRAVGQRIAEFDVLHVHAIWEAAGADLAALFKRAGKPVFVSAHGMLDRWSLGQSQLKKQLTLRLLWTRRLLGSGSTIVFATDTEALEAQDIAPNTPRAIVPNGIDISATRARIAQGRSALLDSVPAIAKWSRTVVYLSRLHPKKGIDQLVEARLALDERFDNVGMLIVGIPQDDILLRSLRARIAQSRLTHMFVLTTDLIGPSAIAALGVSDIFALPSHQEGFSIAILEAMAAGLPLLITDKCHVPQVERWAAGVVVPDTVEGLRIGLEKLLTLSLSELGQTGENARQAVENHFSWASIAERLESLYETEWRA